MKAVRKQGKYDFERHCVWGLGTTVQHDLSSSDVSKERLLLVNLHLSLLYVYILSVHSFIAEIMQLGTAKT